LSFFSVLLLRPRLSTPFPYTTLFRSPQPVAEHGVVLAVEERIGTGQRQLGLVADQWQRGVLLQPSPLIRHKIGHANMADLSVRDGLLQYPRNRPGNHEWVRSMNQKGINLFQLQSLQGSINSLPQVVGLGPVMLGLPAAGVEMARYDAGLGDDAYLLFQARRCGQRFPEVALASAIAVNIGVVKHVKTLVDLMADPARKSLGAKQLRVVEQAHHAEYQRGIA